MVATVTTTTRLSKTSQSQIPFAWKLQWLLSQYDAIERFLVEDIVCCFVSEFYIRWYDKLEAGHNMAF